MLEREDGTKFDHRDIVDLISKACSTQLFFLGSNQEEFKQYRELQKRQFLGVSYHNVIQNMKSALDPRGIFVKDAY